MKSHKCTKSRTVFSTLPLVILCLVFIFSGCAYKGAPTQEDIEKKGKQWSDMTKSKDIVSIDDPYVNAEAVPIRHDEKGSAALNTRVTLRQHGTLQAICSTITNMTNVNVQVGTEPSGIRTANPAPDVNPSQPGAMPPPAVPEPSAAKKEASQDLNISYEGPLRGLLEQLSIASGYGWDYDKKYNTVIFSRLMTRTFTLLAAPGKRSFQDQITNKSKETQRGTIGGSNVNSTVQTSDTSSQTAQTNKTDYVFDVFADTEKAVKSMLSKEGTVVANLAAGTITVRDHADNVRQVGTYIADVNTRLSRQVALTVHVWALEVSDSNGAGIDLQVIFSNPDVSIVAGGLTAIGKGSASSAMATIASGKLKDSVGILEALKKFGNATEVTSGGGLILSNQPVPIQAIKKIAYLAGTSSETTQYGQTTEITPGEVSTGFAMTVVPHILDRRRVLLQYTINLSSLDEMTEFSTGDITVQLPKTSTRSFSQRSTLQMGQVLVLAGFQDQAQKLANSLGLLNIGRKADYSKSLLVITIEVEAAGGGTED